MTNDDWMSGDGELSRALRARYAAPTDEGYWDALEARILARVAHSAERPVWWGELTSMARPGLVAAAVLVLAASLAMARTRQVEATNAYAIVIAAPANGSDSGVPATSVGDGDAAIHLLLSR